MSSIKTFPTNSRARNVKRNLASGLIYRLLNTFLPFAVRTVIIYCLGEQFAGLTNLFTSILQVLNLAELGFSLAIIYHMYKPLANGDDAMVNALLNYYKKIYRNIGLIILAAGLAVAPWITMFIKGDWPSSVNIYLLYFLFLLDSVVSYFMFAYMESLLNALQRLDLSNIARIATKAIQYISQIVVIVVLKNIYAFVVCSIVTSLLTNIIIACIARKKYPQYRPSGELPTSMKKAIKKHVSGVMICKIGDVARNSFDNIILSALLGLTVVAIYGNYYYIFSALYAIMMMATSSIQSSVGNSIATEAVEKNYNDLGMFTFGFSWVMCICCSCMIGLYQPFMKIWVGNDFLLSDLDMILLVIYFYILNMNDARNLYFSGNGLWWKAKLSFTLEAIANLLMNIVLGIWLGTTGIILATIVTIFIFNFIKRTNLLFREYFNKKPTKFYIENLSYFMTTVVICTINYLICQAPFYGDGIPGVIPRVLISLLLGLLFMLPFRKNQNFSRFMKFCRRGKIPATKNR